MKTSYKVKGARPTKGHILSVVNIQKWLKKIFFGRNVLTHMERHYMLDFELLPHVMWPSCEVVNGSSKEGEVGRRKIRGWLMVGDAKVYRNSSL